MCAECILKLKFVLSKWCVRDKNFVYCGDTKKLSLFNFNFNGFFYIPVSKKLKKLKCIYFEEYEKIVKK